MTREHNWADNYILAERFHVVAADLRGYGDSSAPPEEPDSSNYSFRAIAQDEVEVMPAAEVAKILVEADELDRVPADPDPETEPSAAQQVKRGRLLGDEYRLALGEDQHLGRELDVPGTAGEKAEQHKGVMEEIGRRVAIAPIGATRDIDAEHGGRVQPNPDSRSPRPSARIHVWRLDRRRQRHR